MPGSDADNEAGWAGFWSGQHAIYVNDTHLKAHYARIARDVSRLLAGRWRPVLLDWGCGDALGAPDMARAGFELMLYDGVPAVAERLRRRYGDDFRVLDGAAYAALPPAGLDVVLVNSVAQYLSPEHLGRIAAEFRRRLKPDGEFLLGDIIPPDAGMAADIAALLLPAARHGYLAAACAGLVRTFFSDYRRLRQQLGLTLYRETEITALLEAQGFAVERLPRNIGFNQKRMAFRARPRP